VNICTYCEAWPALPGSPVCEACSSQDEADARYTQDLIRAERRERQMAAAVPQTCTGSDAPRDMYVEEFDGIDPLAVA
jgi:hypothetical protein